MGSDWGSSKFRDLYAIPSRNGLTKPKRVRGEGVKFINMGEIFKFNRMKNIPTDRVPVTEKEFETSELEKDDLLFARQSLVLSGAGKCSIFLGDKEPVVFESHLIRVRLDKQKIDPDFLYYFFQSPQGRSEIWAITEQGAGQAGIRGSDLEIVNIPVPPSPEQKAIVHILGSLDDKIELNRQMNETLESMAQALFKNWFVDFDPVIDNALAAGNHIPEIFAKRTEQTKALKKGMVPFNTSENSHQSFFPCEFEFTEELGWIPKGWEVTTLKNLANISSSKRIFAKEYQTQGIPFYRGKEISLLSKGVNLSPEIFITQERFLELKDKFGVPTTGDILLTSVGTIGNSYLVTESDEFYFKDGNLTWFSQYKTEIEGLYIHTWLKTRQAFLAIENIKIGSTQQAITISALNDICLVKPDSSIVTIFNNFIEGNTKKIDINNFEIRSLTKLRDTLLPKLLSGELRIPDAEKLINEVSA